MEVIELIITTGFFLVGCAIVGIVFGFIGGVTLGKGHKGHE